MRLLALVGLLAASVSAEEESDKGCTITAGNCQNFPEYQRTQFRDTIGETHLGAGSNEAACLKRAEDLHHWCGNGAAGGAQIAATYNPSQWTQVYHPGACERGWSQWDAFCYKHYWEKKDWFAAEAACRERDSHLASVHSRAENRFIYTLTSGLSAWIGYTDLDQDTHYKWSDNTQDDFSNFAKNCTGREHEPDCKPEEKKQQWYDWNGGDAGTFVCKRNALVPMAILKNVTAKTMIEKPWSILLPALATDGLSIGGVTGKPSVPDLVVSDLAKPDPLTGSGAYAPKVPEPRLAMPKGSLL